MYKKFIDNIIPRIRNLFTYSKEFLDNQIKKGNISWESRSEIIRASGNSQSGNTARILKEYENKFNFGSITEIKNKEIKKYFDNSFFF